MPAAYHTRIPLDSLFAQLRAEGFEINTATVLDIQKVLANLDEDDVADINTLPSLLGPLICRNKEEQEKFYKICRQYFESVTHLITTQKPIPPKPNNLKLIIIGALILIATVITIVFLSQNKKPSLLSSISITNSRGESELVINDTVTITANWDDSSGNKEYKYNWTIDSISYKGKVIKKVFSQPGQHIAKLKITNKKNKTVSISKENAFIISCEPKPSVEIVKQQSNASSEKVYRAVITNPGNGQYSYLWYLNNKFVSGQKDYYSDYSSDSSYTIQLIVRFDSTVHCSTDSLTTSITETPEIAMAVIGTNPLQISRKLDTSNLFLIIGSLFIIPILTGIGFYRFLIKKRKRKKEESEAAERKKKEQEIIRKQAISAGEEKKYAGPYSIEFASQNDKIFAESGISQLAETLRKRHSSDNYHLNVYKTIRQTIKSGGFPSLQFTPKTQPTDFLILLDNEYPDGHLTKLFSWVIGKLKKEEVQFTSYSFYKEPLLLNNESLSHHLLPLDKLARLYPESIVLIFSTANGFFESYRPHVKNWIKQKFRNWETKLIITPVTKNDWGSKELSLYEAGFTVVPADINAHQVITDEINFMIDKQKLKKKIVPGAYAARQHNFNRWNQLENYLDKASTEIQKTNNNFPGAQLLQKWVCALAVYPHINWNITLAIGKALEEKYCKPGQLVNYTNLLVLSRIVWMNDGQVSDALKKQMLVHLDKESEAVARAAVANALREIEPSINANSLVNDEFIYLKTTNRFLLHTYNEKANELTQQEHLQMKDYVEGNQLDWVLDEYLSTTSNKSLLQQPGTSTSITPEKYFELYNDRDEAFKKQEDSFKAEQERLRKAKVKRQKLMDILRAAAVCLFIAVSVFFTLKKEKVFANLYTIKASTIRFTMEPNSFYSSLKDFAIVLNADSNYNANILNDSDAVIENIALSKVPSAANLSLRGNAASFEQNLDTIYTSYAISFRGKGAMPRLLVRYNKMTDEVSKALQSLSASYNVSYIQQDVTDSNRIIYYNPESKQRADSIVQIVKQSFNVPIPVIYIPENRTPPAPPLLFLNTVKDTGTVNVEPDKKISCSSIALNALPASLSEIWSGNSNNRFIRIEIARKTIYYSTGSKNTYGRYSIQSACEVNNNYKLIVKGDKIFRVFYMRNIQASSFELSLCQQEFKSQAEAEAIDACDAFNRMSLYYQTDPNVIYVPLNTRSYTRSETAKINSLMKSDNKQSLSVMLNAQHNQATTDKRSSLILENNILNKSDKVVWKRGEFNGTPFDRDFISIETPDKPATDLNCNIVYNSLKEAIGVGALKVCKLDLSRENLLNIPKELYGFTNMQQLELGKTLITENEIKQLQNALPKCKIVYQPAKDQTMENMYYFIAALQFDKENNPNSVQTNFLEQLGKYLRNYPSARVGLDFRYSRGSTASRENAVLNTTRTILEKAGAPANQVSRISATESVQQQQQQQQQQQKREQVVDIAPGSSDLDKVLIYVWGIPPSSRKTLQDYLTPKAAGK